MRRALAAPSLLKYASTSVPWRSHSRIWPAHHVRLLCARRRSTLVTERGKHLHAAARALAAGRGLLATHVGNDADGERVKRSAWAAVLGTPAISRAAAGRNGRTGAASRSARPGLAMATPADWAEVSQARSDLAGACGYLRILAGAITAAHRLEPVLAVDSEVLRAIPVATVPLRRPPEPRDSVAAICRGVIDAAARLRHSAGAAAERAWSSPDVSADSLRHAAAAAMAASHHCSVLLGTQAGQWFCPLSGALGRRSARRARGRRSGRSADQRISTRFGCGTGLGQPTRVFRGRAQAPGPRRRDLARRILRAVRETGR